MSRATADFKAALKVPRLKDDSMAAYGVGRRHEVLGHCMRNIKRHLLP